MLGPLLFLLYINDLPESIQSQVRLFADYTAVYLTVSSPADKQVLQSAYNTLVRPQVEYVLNVWSPYTKENINKIAMLQRRATCWFTNDFSPYSSVTDMIGELGWRSLELRRYDARLTIFYKIVNGFVAITIPSQFERLKTNTHHRPLAYRQMHTSVSYYYYSFSL